MAIGRDAWQLLYQMTPIILVGGLFKDTMPAGMVPIILLTEGISLPFNILNLAFSASRVATGSLLPKLDDAFAHFTPLSGMTVIDQQIATYPFANMRVAGNALVEQPLGVSYHMTSPARGTISYWSKLAQMMALIELLKQHNRLGGMYHLLTPSALLTNCVMRNMRDVSSSATKQVQNVWQLDFQKPLLTVSDANEWAAKLNDYLSQVTGGQQATTPLVPPSVPSYPNGPI